jgi:hypothetical protein
MKLFFDNLHSTQSAGQQHAVSEAIKVGESFFDDFPDYVHGQMDFPFGGTMCHFVKTNWTAVPNHIGKSTAFSSFSSSAVSSSKSFSMSAGFGVSASVVSVSASMSASSSQSDSSYSFTGVAKAYDADYKLSVNSFARPKTSLIEGLGDFDGSPQAVASYTSKFKQIGLYFVTEVTTGGSYEYNTKITKTAEADAHAYAIEFRVQAEFVTLSGSVSHTDKHQQFTENVNVSSAQYGGDDVLRNALQGYLPMVKDEKIDTQHFQADLTNFFKSVPLNPDVLEMKVEHILDRLNIMPNMSISQRNAVDNMRMAYDHIFSDLRDREIKILRVQYGISDSFDRPDGLYIDLPADLKQLPYDAATNRGFGTRYDPAHSCPAADSAAASRRIFRTLRYYEYCDANNLLVCDAHTQPWCALLTSGLMGRQAQKELNAELWIRISFVAGVGNEFQYIDFKPCGYGAAWAIYWNNPTPFDHERNRQAAAKIIGPFYQNVAGGKMYSDDALDLFPCTEANKMKGFADDDSACCDSLPGTYPDWFKNQQQGCGKLGGKEFCTFPPNGPLQPGTVIGCNVLKCPQDGVNRICPGIYNGMPVNLGITDARKYTPGFLNVTCPCGPMTGHGSGEWSHTTQPNGSSWGYHWKLLSGQDCNYVPCAMLYRGGLFFSTNRPESDCRCPDKIPNKISFPTWLKWTAAESWVCLRNVEDFQSSQTFV